MSSRRDGFTAIEVLIASALLSVLLLTGVVVSRTAMDSANYAVIHGGLEARLAKMHASIENLLLSASRATLQGIPPAGKVPEVLQQGVAYDNLSFRRVASFTKGVPTYDPPLTAPARRLWWQSVGPNANGTIFTSDGTHTTAVLDGVSSITFTLQNRRLTIRIVATAHDEHGTTTSDQEEAITLRVP